MEILILLVERRGNLLTRAEIAAHLWPALDAADVVQSINTAINRIRFVLRDDPARPKYIQTVIGKGYRFVAEVKEIEVRNSASQASNGIAFADLQPNADPPLTLVPDPTPIAPPLIAEEPLARDQPYRAEESLLPTLDRGHARMTPAARLSIPQDEATHQVTPARPDADMQSTPERVLRSTIVAFQATFRRWWWAYACVSVILLGAAVAVHGRQPVSHLQHEEEGFEEDLGRLTRSDNRVRKTAMAVSPDGRHLAYARTEGVVVEEIATRLSRTLPVADAVSVEHLAWLPDGQHLLVSSLHGVNAHPQVWLMTVADGTSLLLRDGARMAVPSSDGSQIAWTTANGSEIWIGNGSAAGARRLFAGSSYDTFPVMLWSANGKTILAERRTLVVHLGHSANVPEENEPGFHTDYVAVSAESGRITATTEGVRFNAACLLREGELLFATAIPHNDGPASHWFLTSIDPETGAFLSSPRQVHQDARTEDLGWVGANNQLFALMRRGSPNIFTAAYQAAEHRLGAPKRLTFAENEAYTHSWTLDSSSILLEINEGGHYLIEGQSPGQTEGKPLVDVPGQQVWPRPSPDGKWILFANKPLFAEGSRWQLFRIPSTGGTPIHVETGETSAEYRCASKGDLCVIRDVDKQNLLEFDQLDPVRGRGAPIWTMPVVSTNEGDWDLSPDGSTLAIAPATSVTPTIELVPTGAGKSSGEARQIQVELDSPIVDLEWAANGKGWFASTYTNSGSDLYFVDLSGAVTLMHQASGETWGIPSPDGHSLAFEDQVVDSSVWLFKQK